MKTFLIFLLLIFITGFFGCKKSKDVVIETKTITKEYVKGAEEIPKKTRVITELASLRQAIKMYKVQNEKYPESLSDLKVKVKDIQDYEYDSETGQVKSRYYPKY
jgi:hypothetical protein